MHLPGPWGTAFGTSNAPLRSLSALSEVFIVVSVTVLLWALRGPLSVQCAVVWGRSRCEWKGSVGWAGHVQKVTVARTAYWTHNDVCGLGQNQARLLKQVECLFP